MDTRRPASRSAFPLATEVIGGANTSFARHSLSDGTRRAVIAQLAHGPASVGDLALRHRMALPSFMKHIRVLEESEIVVSRKTGRARMCGYVPKR